MTPRTGPPGARGSPRPPTDWIDEPTDLDQDDAELLWQHLHPRPLPVRRPCRLSDGSEVSDCLEQRDQGRAPMPCRRPERPPELRTADLMSRDQHPHVGEIALPRVGCPTADHRLNLL